LLHVGGDVERDPEQQYDRLDDDESPRSHGGGDPVGYFLPRRERGPMGATRLLRAAARAAQGAKFLEQPPFGLAQLDFHGRGIFHGAGPSSV
jgi:hypothetical protein